MTNTRRYYTGLIFFIVLIMLSLLRVAFSFGLGNNMTDNQLNITYTLISQVFCMGILPFGLYIILILRKEKRPSIEIFKDFGFKMPHIGVIILAVVAAFVFYYLTIGIAAIWTGLLTVIGYQLPISPGTIYTSPSDLVLWVIITAMLPGVFEEFTHRGLLINGYSESSEVEAVIYSALLFGFMHQDIRQFGYTVAGGVILAFFFTKSRSILPPMILHFTNNAINSIMDYSSQTGGALGKLWNSFFELFTSGVMALLLMVSWVFAAALLFLILIAVDILSAKKNGVPTTWNKGFKISKLRFNRDDIFMYAAVILGVVTTIFSLIWNIMR